VIDGAGGAYIEISPRAARVVVESSTVTGCAGGSGLASTAKPEFMSVRVWSRLTQPWYAAGECGAVEIEVWSLLQPEDPFHPDDLSVEMVLRECQIVGNLGPGLSVRSFAGGSDAPDREYVDALAARITIEGGSVGGYGKAPGVLSSTIGEGGAVVWNKTKRAKRYLSAQGVVEHRIIDSSEDESISEE
jgi:hypothetical protein